MKVWLVQMEVHLKDKDKNLDKIHCFLDEAIKQKVDLIAFPETVLTGYLCRTDFLNLAEPIPGPSTKDLIQRATKEKIYIALGMPELREGFIYNAAPLFGPQGLVGVHRKLFLPNHISAKGVRYEEQMFFKPGNEIVTFETGFGKIGMQICYDIWFPEIARSYAVNGAWFILNLSAGPLGVPEVFRLLCRVRAMENICYFGMVNQIGTQENIVFGGGSCVAGYLSDMIAEGSIGEMAKEEIVECDISQENVQPYRFYLPILRNVRSEIAEQYWKIVKER